LSSFELVGQNDRVDRLALVVELTDGSEDDLVGVAIKVLRLEDRNDLVEHLVVAQDATQNAQLGFEILRW
jgi:hypothetical protein